MSPLQGSNRIAQPNWGARDAGLSCAAESPTAEPSSRSAKKLPRTKMYHMRQLQRDVILSPPGGWIRHRPFAAVQGNAFMTIFWVKCPRFLSERTDDHKQPPVFIPILRAPHRRPARRHNESATTPADGITAPNSGTLTNTFSLLPSRPLGRRRKGIGHDQMQDGIESFMSIQLSDTSGY